MIHIPPNWSLTAEYDGNYIFRNAEESMAVNITFDEGLEFPYYIDFSQLKGIFILWPLDEGGYVCHATSIEEAFFKAVQMMKDIDVALAGKEVVV
jgi:hypothetical protein